MGYGAPMGGQPYAPQPYAPQPPAVHRPGPGLVVALAGLALFFAALVALPWVAAPAGGEDAKLSDWADLSDEEAEAGDVEAVAGYADVIWIVALVALTIAVVTSTLAVPQSVGGRVALGFLTAGLLGLLHLADKRGTWAHRVCGAAATVVWALMHAGAVADLFTFDGESTDVDAGLAIPVGFVGLLLVLVGCIIGTRIDKTAGAPYGAPAYGQGYYR